MRKLESQARHKTCLLNLFRSSNAQDLVTFVPLSNQMSFLKLPLMPPCVTILRYAHKKLLHLHKKMQYMRQVVFQTQVRYRIISSESGTGRSSMM